MSRDNSKTGAKYSIELPQLNANGCFEVRLESIGGLGANLCGKLLGELGAAYLGLNAASFSSYGSEKRGSAVKAYVRFSAPEREILHNSPIEHPHILALFHLALAGTMPVTAGVRKNCTVVVNTSEAPEKTREILKLSAGKIFCVDALDIAMRTHSRVNMIMLGAIIKASEFIPLDAARDIVRESIGKKYPAMLEKNLAGLEAGYNEVRSQSFIDDGYYKEMEYREAKSLWGYDNAPIGGVNPHIGSTVSNDLSPSREGYIPLFLPEKCIHCGLCDSTCPDMVFQFVRGEYKGKSAMLNRGLDYHHCKGCLRCVEICPTEALVCGKEAEHPEKKYFFRNKDLIAKHIDFDMVGADPYITGEAYLDEKRVDGGIV